MTRECSAIGIGGQRPAEFQSVAIGVGDTAVTQAKNRSDLAEFEGLSRVRWFTKPLHVGPHRRLAANRRRPGQSAPGR